MVQTQIARQLELYNNGDTPLTDSTELCALVTERAQEADKLADLWDSVENWHKDGKYLVNPFRHLITKQ